MIVTVTLNPSLDRTLEVGHLTRGSLVRAEAARRDPGGKGVNVSRALAAHGIKTCAVVPISGSEGVELARLLALEGIAVSSVPVVGPTRSNVSVVEPDGSVTKINEPGGVLTEDELDEIVAAVLNVAAGSDWVVVSGSLPPSVPYDFYRRLCGLLHGGGVRVALDSSGPALTAALASAPALVKPNRDELAELVGFRVDTLADAVRAANVMRAAGADTVLASLGADGAVLVDESGVRYGDSPVGERRSPVGAGDAMLAGFIAAMITGRDPLIEALSWGAATVRFPGSRMPGPQDIDRTSVRIQPEPDLSRQLRGVHHPDLGDRILERPMS